MRSSLRLLVMATMVLLAVSPAASQSTQLQGGAVALPSSNNSDVTTLPNGDFVVVWSSTNYIQGTLVSGGTPGATFNVSNYFFSGGGATVDSDDAGNFWVAWQQSGYGSFARGFNSATTPTTAPFAVGGISSYTPLVGARKATGGFVVVYNDSLYSLTRAQGFNAAGVQDFAPTTVWPYYSVSSTAKLGIDPAGNFLVVWSGDYLQAATFDSTGASITSFSLASPPPSKFDVSGLGTGNFVVAWREYVGAPSYSNYVRARLATTTGPNGGPFDVASGVSYNTEVAVSGNASEFVVVWSEPYVLPAKTGKVQDRNNARLPSATSDVTARAFTSGGVPVGSPVVMNAGYPAYGTQPARVSMNSNQTGQGGQFTVLWRTASSAYAQAAVVCPAATEPSRVAPLNGASYNAPIDFQWNAVVGATDYDVWVRVNGGTFTLQGNTTALSLTNQAVPEGSIEWYVVANFAGTCPSSPVPTVFGFFTVCPTATEPSRVAPVDGASYSAPIDFQWNAVVGATDYDVWLRVNGGTFTLQGNTTALSLTNQAVPAGSIEWYVVSNFAGTCPSSPVPTVFGFFTVCPTATAPTLTSPIGGASVVSPVTFSWAAVTGAVSYDVYVGVGAAPTLVGNTTGTTFGPGALASGSGSWYVVANFGAGCPTAQSATETFQVCPTTTTPTLLSPAAGANESSPVTFQWTGDANAVAYDVFAGVNGATPSLIGTVSAPTTSLSATVAPGSVDWYVVSKYGTGCPTASSATGTFTACPAITPPALLVPANGDSVTSPVTFQWTDVGASIYEVWLAVNGGSYAMIGTSSTTSLQAAVAEGEVEWFVKALVGSCFATSSTHFFTVGIPFVCPEPSTPTLTAPEDGAVFDIGEFVTFEWTAAPDAASYEVWGKINGGLPRFIGSTANTSLTRAIAEGTTEWYVITSFGPGCESTTSASRTVTTEDEEPPIPPDCGLKDAPIPGIVGGSTSGESYNLIWDALEGAARYHVQEAADASFFNIISEQTVEALHVSFNHPDLTQPTPFFYRVAGIKACEDGDKQGPYSPTVRVVGLPKPPPSSTNPQVVTEFGNEDFVETSLFIPGFGGSAKTASEATFSVSSNEPWLTVSPASGILPPEGTTVGLLASPKDLGLGANTATVTVTRDDGLGKTTSGGSTSSVPVAVSLVTPVSPVPKGVGPPENALIIPAVANVTGLTSKWFSDVKVTNRSTQMINYEINFSATDKSGTVEGKQTKISIRPRQTVALDDVVRQWFGQGDLADGTNGALEIRPINFNGKVGPEAAPMLATVASSRTYTRAEDSLASYGQFIPAVPFSSFLKAGVQDSLLMMQQVSQTESLRTNFGIVEGAGKDVNVLLTAYDRQGTKLGEFPVDLKAGEHKQLNSLLALNGISVQDGRMSVQIVGGEGAVTSYASVVASGTGDPSLVPGVDPSSLSAKRYVLPGVADLRVGSANWRSDVRIFNPNDAPESVNVFFYPQGETTPLGPVEIQIQPGEIEVLEGVVESLFGRQDLGGALHVTPISGQDTSLVITGETYDVSELGKYGQFIPAVTEANAIGVGSPGLEVMQVEESAQFRTNLGLAEVTGQSATVQVQLTVPNSLSAPTRQITLNGNEFQQLNGVVREMSGGRDVYNGRLTVRVIGGVGKITAYGSTVDNQTRDATFSAGQ